MEEVKAKLKLKTCGGITEGVRVMFQKGGTGYEKYGSETVCGLLEEPREIQCVSIDREWGYLT